MYVSATVETHNTYYYYEQFCNVQSCFLLRLVIILWGAWLFGAMIMTILCHDQMACCAQTMVLAGARQPARARRSGPGCVIVARTCRRSLPSGGQARLNPGGPKGERGLMFHLGAWTSPRGYSGAGSAPPFNSNSDSFVSSSNVNDECESAHRLASRWQSSRSPVIVSA